jgi:hypothetical protein
MPATRVALIVANDEYLDADLHRLAAPSSDADALAQVLRDSGIGGFDVQVLRNALAQQLRVTVEDFFADRGPQDLLLLHFSCHGLKNASGELFLAAADTRPSRLASTALAADFVNRQMVDSRAQGIALFLDCCYGGAFPRGMVIRAGAQAEVRSAFEGQERVGGGRGRVVVTASSAVEYAFEGDRLAPGAARQPSVFTAAVVDGLASGEADRDGDGWVGLSELFSHVSDQVRRTTPHQTPHMWTFGAQGELLIARSRRRRLTATPLPAELAEAKNSPLAMVRFGIVEELRQRLHGEDLGQALTAYQTLKLLADDDSRRVSQAATEALLEMTHRTAPEAVDFGLYELGSPPPEREIEIVGPPLAAVVSVTADQPWVRVVQEERVIRLTLDVATAGEYGGAVVLTGPTGGTTIQVRALVRASSSSVRAEKTAIEPPAETAAATVLGSRPTVGAKPVASVDATTPASSGAEALRRASTMTGARWLAVGAALCLVVVGGLLAYINWPGQPTPELWCACSNVRIDSSWWDGYLLAALAMVGGAGLSLWRPVSAAVGLGISAGAGVFLVVSGALILELALTAEIPDEHDAWVQTVLLSALSVVIAAVAVLRLGPWSAPRYRRPGISTGVLLTAGAVTIGVAQFLPVTAAGDSVVELGIGWSLAADLFFLASCVFMAVSVFDGYWQRVLSGALATSLLLLVVNSWYVSTGLSVGRSDYYIAETVGYALLLGSLGAAIAQRTRGETS